MRVRAHRWDWAGLSSRRRHLGEFSPGFGDVASMGDGQSACVSRVRVCVCAIGI